MNNFELIDDYLTNRLNEQDQKSFEQQMTADPSLRADVELQREIIESLKSARVAELKSMLSKIPVATPTLYFSPLRIAAGVIGTAVLATGLYFFYIKNENTDSNQISSSLTDSIQQAEQGKSEILVDSAFNETESIIPVEKEIQNTEIRKEDKRIQENQKESKPAIDLIDPTEELSGNQIPPEKSVINNTLISLAKIEISVNASDKKFKSHYQFANGKLVLYGHFDNGLYEIIEVNAQQSRSLFLYYKTSYFLLDETAKEVTLLKEISDPLLLQKLKTFRSK